MSSTRCGLARLDRRAGRGCGPRHPRAFTRTISGSGAGRSRFAATLRQPRPPALSKLLVGETCLLPSTMPHPDSGVRSRDRPSCRPRTCRAPAITSPSPHWGDAACRATPSGRCCSAPGGRGRDGDDVRGVRLQDGSPQGVEELEPADVSPAFGSTSSRPSCGYKPWRSPSPLIVGSSPPPSTKGRRHQEGRAHDSCDGSPMGLCCYLANA
jgi:hypothetical protein